jgi:hypothetical protein
MFGQQITRLVNALKQALGEIRFVKMRAHRVRQFPPESFTAFDMRTRVSDNANVRASGATKIRTPLRSRVFSLRVLPKWRITWG